MAENVHWKWQSKDINTTANCTDLTNPTLLLEILVYHSSATPESACIAGEVETKHSYSSLMGFWEHPQRK